MMLQQKHVTHHMTQSSSVSRRNVLAVPAILNLLLKSLPTEAKGLLPWKVASDPETFSALAYSPPSNDNENALPPPLILFLHGAGINERDISNLIDPNGEHAGLLPSLVSTGQAPKLLLDKFAILAPYSFGKRSFYEEPRSKLLSFLNWASTPVGQQAGCPIFDSNKIFLFGFSDGATLAVELMTTRRFAGAVVCSYGFTGTLPEYALERLTGLPMWIFHSVDDVIFPVSCSDKLFQSLNGINNTKKEIVRYSRFDQDPEGFTGRVKGHSTGITASKDPEVYKWLLTL